MEYWKTIPAKPTRTIQHKPYRRNQHIINTNKTNKNYTGEAKTPGQLSKTKPPKNTQLHT